jgi:tRNA-2-methylthio-N6-dimethylallyladenosine synthase
VSISTGCDNACSYCIVPAVRGPLVSRAAAAVLEEVRGLAATGCREVVLLGQNVDSFGRDRGEEGAFARLLERVAAVEGVRRVRFTTSHPRDLDLPTLRAMAAHPNICRHLHLPAQSGSDAILARMGRGYTRDRYLDLLARARRLLGDLAVTTDLIVGFPGETEEEFGATLELVDRARFTGAFTFMFSPRPGTAAAGLPDQVPLDTKKRRLRRLMERVNFWSGQANLALVGRVEEVLAEGPSPRHPGMLAGRTGGNRLVRFPAEGGGAGRMARVEIIAARTWTLEGRVVGWE